MWADEAYDYAQVFSGDTLHGAERRRGLAVEPMTCPPDAFNAPDPAAAGVVRLAPGDEHVATWGLALGTAADVASSRSRARWDGTAPWRRCRRDAVRLRRDDPLQPTQHRHHHGAADEQQHDERRRQVVAEQEPGRDRADHRGDLEHPGADRVVAAAQVLGARGRW